MYRYKDGQIDRYSIHTCSSLYSVKICSVRSAICVDLRCLVSSRFAERHQRRTYTLRPKVGTIDIVFALPPLRRLCEACISSCDAPSAGKPGTMN